MKDEQARFGERLRNALKDARIDDGPVALMKRFNSRYDGPSVSSQAVSQWLTGKVMPRQDKVRALAELLDVDVHWLQTGEGRSGRLRESQPAWPDALSPAERRTIETFLRLPDDSRRLVSELVRALSGVAKSDRSGR